MRMLYHYFRQWRDDGTWERRDAQPNGRIVDSQSVKTTRIGGPRDYDGVKKFNARKGYVLVGPQGLVLRAAIHEANIADRDGIILLLLEETTEDRSSIRERFPRLAYLWLDSGYNGAGRGKS